jgi:hypothetical protein
VAPVFYVGKATTDYCPNQDFRTYEAGRVIWRSVPVIWPMLLGPMLPRKIPGKRMYSLILFSGPRSADDALSVWCATSDP